MGMHNPMNMELAGHPLPVSAALRFEPRVAGSAVGADLGWLGLLLCAASVLFSGSLLWAGARLLIGLF